MNDAFLLQRERRRLIALAVVALALVGGALYLQFALHEDPCPLCILQRYAYLLIAIFALVGAAQRNWRGIRIAESLVLLSAIGGAVAAGKLVAVQSHPSFGCGFDALEPIVDALPPAKLLPQVFQVGGLCETTYPPIFGVSLPQWALFGFVVIFVLVMRSMQRGAVLRRA
jgi:disulfide bond formation protein DsbB